MTRVLGIDPYYRPCDQCGTQFRVRPSDVTKAKARGGNPPRFCTRACRDLSYRGPGNPKWRGGQTTTADGYIYELAPRHPYATADGYVMQHRLVMERAIGRFLEPTEEVHHRNHTPDDNQLANLELMGSTAEHRVRHAYYEFHPCRECGTPVRNSAGDRRRGRGRFCSRPCSAASGSRRNAENAQIRKEQACVSLG